jgi:hypothetical protein
MFEEDHRIIAAKAGAQQADGVLRIGRDCNQPAGIVDELHFIGLAVPGIADLEEAAGHAQHHGCGKAIVGAPAHGAAIVDLLDRRLGIFAELDFRHRHQAGHGHPTARPTMPSSLRLVSKTRSTPYLS